MIQDYLKAGYPAILLFSQEPHPAENALPCDGWNFLLWDCLRGFRQAGKQQVIDEIRDPVEAVNRLGDMQDTVLLASNLHLFLDIPEVIQAIQNGVARWKSTGCCLVMSCPVVQLRPELEKLFHICELPLPSEQELFAMQQELAKGVSLQNESGDPVDIAADDGTARAAKGLTEFEAETAFALSLVERGRFSRRVITEVKAQMIRKSGLMEFWEPADIKDVGGLGNLKSYIANRAKAFLPGNEHLPRPKGILLCGVPGTGKSLSCKATASVLGWPLIRLDFGALKNSLVGESERRMREATRVIDAFQAEQAGYNVLIIDSLSHAWAGTGSILDIKARIAKSVRGMNDFTAWREATPKHNELVDTILGSSCHIIVTLRTKTAYEVIQEDGKKAKVTKLGLAFIQRDGIEYEFTVVLDLSVDGHIATSTKDRTGLFDGNYITPTEDTGKQLLAWLNSGQDPKEELIGQINTLMGRLNLSELMNAYWIYAGNRYQAESIDQIRQGQLQEQISLLAQCQQNPAKLDQFQKLLNDIADRQQTGADSQQGTVH